jgi:murein DD-endopeptidase MepM/ murein hydrolase activator NlpD
MSTFLKFNKKVNLGLYLCLIALLVFPGAMAAADPMSNQQLQAINEWPSWVAASGCDNTTGDCCSGSASSDASLNGSTNAEKAFNYFVQQQGLTAAGAAGIVGNMMLESGGNTEKLDTHAHNDAYGTHDGIVQWSTDRWNALKSHESGDPYSLSVQLDYVWYELNHTYTATLKFLKTATSARDAASAFNNGPPLPAFEASGSSGDPGNMREANAQKIFTKYGQGAGGSATASASGDCASTSSADISAYKNPLRDWKNLKSSRVDQGVDYNGVGPVYAIGDGVIDFAGTHTGWPGGNYVSYALAGGPAKGKEVYVSEDCALEAGITKGKHVTSDTILCRTAAPSNIYIETGWSAEKIDNAIDVGLNMKCYDIKNSTSTAFGMNFFDLMKALGVNVTTEVDRPISCTLPNNWPTWK